MAPAFDRATSMVRSWGGAIVALALLQATVVAWVAWYLVDAAWTAAPLSASPTPLPGVVFTGAGAAGAVMTAVAGVLLGATVERAVWVRAIPTRVLPITPARRLFETWCASVVITAVATAAVIPVYLAIAELGGVTSRLALCTVAVHAAALAFAPLAGLGVARLRR